MGKAYSHMIKRPVKNWNAEQRAMKQLDKMEKSKPAQAPRHPSTYKFIDDALRGNVFTPTSFKSKMQLDVCDVNRLQLVSS